MNPFSMGRKTVRWNTQYVEETISILTQDEYNVPIDFQVTYHLQEDKVGDILTENPDYKDTVIRNILRSEVRKTASNMEMTGTMLNQKRSVFEERVQVVVTERCIEYYVEVESVNVRNIDLPKQILDASEMRAGAKIDIETAEYELQAESARAQKEELRAQAEANATIILAIGQAESLQILEEVSMNMTGEMMDYILSLRYIAALRDPECNVQFVIVPMEGSPIILDMAGLEEQAVNATV